MPTRQFEKSRPLSPGAPNGVRPRAMSGNTLQRLLMVVVTIWFVLACFRTFRALPITFGPWVDAVLLIMMTAATVVGLMHQLPGQNVMVATVLIAVIASVMQVIGVTTSIPFGPFVYTNEIGPRFFDALAWSTPFLWVAVILSSRGVARLVMRPWRKTRTYGYWVIGLTCLLTVVLDIGLEPFASVVNHYWLWQPTRLKFDWYGAPWVNFIGWLVTALLILGFATPWLINKKPARSSPPDYQPLVLWLVISAYFTIGNAAHQLWLAAGLGALASLVAATFAVRGAKW